MGACCTPLALSDVMFVCCQKGIAAEFCQIFRISDLIVTDASLHFPGVICKQRAFALFFSFFFFC
ncbi:hypothetical_protein [Leishmania braziliensis MHOM/BR/75/M2904]|uniref:Hypothetical_protein n=1 Tax=Leishmania braziliensis MHOM/BR/75/M2904 TaxID=420245 RepID=A0A3P3YWN6_LEIBR|nr:hypothetical_protein [Leishmania braziliensis MHOM/BR/75/M2904]